MSFLWQWMIFNVLVLLASCSNIAFHDSGYSGIVVAIRNADPSDAQKIINNIQKMITEASPVLNTATEERSYFKEIRILIPPTWTHISADESTWETFEEADVQVDKETSPAHYIPHVKQPGDCGDPGEYMFLSVDFIINMYTDTFIHTYGPPERIFVHEWAHLRYGVFDEYANDREGYSKFYLHGSTIRPTMCANQQAHYEAINITTKRPCHENSAIEDYNRNCDIVWLPSFQPTSSLMFNHSSPSIIFFCDDGQDKSHNILAPNKHNAKCNKQSVWKVITSHQDFKNSKATVSKQSHNLQPEFHIVRQKTSAIIHNKFVLVMDVSDSMANYNKMGKMRQAASIWIQSDAPSGSRVGMVQFSEKESVIVNLTEITDSSTRTQFIEKIPTATYTSSCISCGLQLAAQMLQQSGEGGIILLFTDGFHSPGLRPIENLSEILLKNKIRVVTFAYSRQAHLSIDRLADLTGGKIYFDDADLNVTKAVNEVVTFQGAVDPSTIIYKLHESSIRFKTSTYKGEFNVDLFTRRNLLLEIIPPLKKSTVRSLRLISPYHQNYTNVKYRSNATIMTIDSVLPGLWKYELIVKKKPKITFNVTVTAQSTSKTAQAITTKCRLLHGEVIQTPAIQPIKIYAEVSKGNNPVVGASVKAYVEKPNLQREIIKLYDDGTNGDTTARDGLYSAYYTNIDVPGQYGVKCQIENSGTAYVSDGFIGSASLVNKYDYSSFPNEPLEPFVRIEAAGSFMIENPLPSEDPYPPGPVYDLRSIHSESTNTTVTLEWTAPGDDLDKGKAAYYEVRYTQRAEELLDFQFSSNLTRLTGNDVINGSLEPLNAGEIQRVTFILSHVDRDEAYFIALRAVDKAGKTGRVSNIISIYIPRVHVEGNVANFPSLTQPMEMIPMHFRVVSAIWIAILIAVPFVAVVVFLIMKRSDQSKYHTRGWAV